MDFTKRITELKKLIEESKTDSEIADTKQKQVIKLMKQTIDILSNKDNTSKEEYEILMNMQKEMHHDELEWFRSKANMIRKFSSKSADELDKEIVGLENLCRASDMNFNNFIKNPDMKYPFELLQSMEMETNKFTLLDKNVKLCTNCIKDTLEKISGLKNN